MEYLGKAGTSLTNDYGLCNIGQWHSHHKIQLFVPSVGDENTVWNNMPNLGLDRYIVFIANITHEVTINCFLFQIKNGRKLPVMPGKFELLKGNSPFRLDEKLLQITYEGLETSNDIAVFEEEMKHLRDMPENHNFETYNKNETRNDTGNRKQKVNLSANQENNEKIYNPHINTHSTQLNKRKLLEVPERNSYNTDIPPDTFRKSENSNSLDKASKENLKSYHPPKESKKKNEQKAEKITYTEGPETEHLSTSNPPGQVSQKQLVDTKLTHSANEQQRRRNYSLAQTTQRQNKYEATVTGSNQTQQYRNTEERRYIQQEKRDVNFRVNIQSSSSSSFAKESKDEPSGSYKYPNEKEKQDEQIIEVKTSKDSGSCIHPCGTLREHMKTFGNEKRYTTKNPSSEDTQQKAFLIVTYKGTESQQYNVITKQPQTSGYRHRNNLKRKSEEYDNVCNDYEPPKCKTSKLNNDDNELSEHGNLEKIRRKRHEDRQTRQYNDDENTTINFLCGMMSQLTIHDKREIIQQKPSDVKCSENSKNRSSFEYKKNLGSYESAADGQATSEIINYTKETINEIKNSQSNGNHRSQRKSTDVAKSDVNETKNAEAKPARHRTVHESVDKTKKIHYGQEMNVTAAKNSK